VAAMILRMSSSCLDKVCDAQRDAWRRAEPTGIDGKSFARQAYSLRFGFRLSRREPLPLPAGLGRISDQVFAFEEETSEISWYIGSEVSTIDAARLPLPRWARACRRLGMSSNCRVAIIQASDGPRRAGNRPAGSHHIV